MITKVIHNNSVIDRSDRDIKCVLPRPERYFLASQKKREVITARGNYNTLINEEITPPTFLVCRGTCVCNHRFATIILATATAKYVSIYKCTMETAHNKHKSLDCVMTYDIFSNFVGYSHALRISFQLHQRLSLTICT